MVLKYVSIIKANIKECSCFFAPHYFNIPVNVNDSVFLQILRLSVISRGILCT